MARIKNIKNQLPMDFMLPQVDWTPPTSLPDLTGHGDLAIDLETRDNGLAADRGPGWAHHDGYVTGVVISSVHESVYAPVAHPDTECLDHETVGRWLRAHMHRPRSLGRLLFQNGPYDLGWAWAEWGIDPPESVDDTLAMAFCVDENRLGYSLDALCRWQGIPGKDESALKQAAEAFGYHPKKELWRLPARYVAPYAMQDGSSTLELGHRLLPQLEAQQLTEAYQLEADLIPMCHHMRRRGVRVNTDVAEQSQIVLFGKRDAALRQLSEKFPIGRQWAIDDIRSHTFLRRIFDGVNERLPSDQQIPIPQTEKGNDSFSKDWMKGHEHPLPSLVSRALSMHDAADKFLGNFILGFTHLGRIHAEIHQFKGEDRGGTRTTRFAYSNPPLQQMPSRDEEIAPITRACFEPEEGEVWAAVDYSQQEFRLMVHFAAACRIEGVGPAVDMYRNDPDTDFHDMVVQLTGLPRRRAKDVNFAKAFGAGPPKFALMTGMSLEEAKAAMAEYDDRLPWMSRLSEFCQHRVDQRGYIRMIDGFRGHFDRWEPRWVDYEKVRAARDEARRQGLPQPETDPTSLDEARSRKNDPNHPWYGTRLRRAFTHKALNTLIQGSAARQMKKAMLAIHREGVTLPLLQMHDELDLSVSSRETALRVGEIMSEIVPLLIPVKCDVEFGVNWGLAAKDKASGHMATWEEAMKEKSDA